VYTRNRLASFVDLFNNFLNGHIELTLSPLCMARFASMVALDRQTGHSKFLSRDRSWLASVQLFEISY
jgi:hypothetical protein